VVLDTNVVLSALVFASGPTGRMRQAWQASHCLPLVSRATAAELLRVLACPKFKLGTNEREELLADYLPDAEVVAVPDPPPRMPPTAPDCRDPQDLPFLHLALAGQAQALITGNQDLLVLAGVLPFEVLRCETWLARQAAA
jgi:putative PIN family toxin of toxin-antitoxin system